MGFGLLGDRRPFGEDILAHPLIIYCLAVAAGLLILRFIGGRPVPEIISEHALGRGCALGLVMFLIGNFIAAHVIGVDQAFTTRVLIRAQLTPSQG